MKNENEEKIHCWNRSNAMNHNAILLSSVAKATLLNRCDKREKTDDPQKPGNLLPLPWLGSCLWLGKPMHHDVLNITSIVLNFMEQQLTTTLR